MDVEKAVEFLHQRQWMAEAEVQATRDLIQSAMKLQMLQLTGAALFFQPIVQIHHRRK
jgi:hypothetical protein